MDNLQAKRKLRAFELGIFLISLFVIFLLIYGSFKLKENFFQGFSYILTSQAGLITDFLMVGGISAGFSNALLILGFNYFIIRFLNIEIKGMTLASLFTIFGFSFFGKNILNILPIYIGGILFSKYDHIPFKDIYLPVSFATALAPFISEVAFRTNTFEFSYINGITLGIIIGFIISPLAKKMKGFHEGYNLYNLGFTAGILGLVLNCILKAYDFNVASRKILSTQYNSILQICCSIIFLILIIVGFYINSNSFSGYKELVKSSGLEVDFVASYGYGVTFVNMGLMGFLAMLFALSLGQTLNGPILAGIFTVVGFAAHGKTPFNTAPILIGVILSGVSTIHNDIFTIVLSGLFGTSLAPIAGIFGPFWGILAGWLHLTIVTNIGGLHGGLNLYNNGFSAGIVAGFLLPIMRIFNERGLKRELQFLKNRKEFIGMIKKSDFE
ncbi:DUF1576 domain-containing protein [Fusobacterium sp.]|uniref:DUF1576 domain-containing protein n=1 Tax=Fusobacterium sp. TaxID=68766 RepID=UPI00262E0837|nr:DUF1576 domain-containing protein [Fusobacterium sp.]